MILMGVRNLAKICEHLIVSTWMATTPVALIQSGTTRDETLVVTDLRSAPQAAEEMGLQSPAIIVIGDVCSCLPKSTKSTAHAPETTSRVWGAARKPV